jgi:hypothetical protein
MLPPRAALASITSPHHSSVGRAQGCKDLAVTLRSLVRTQVVRLLLFACAPFFAPSPQHCDPHGPFWHAPDAYGPQRALSPWAAKLNAGNSGGSAWRPGAWRRGPWRPSAWRPGAWERLRGPAARRLGTPPPPPRAPGVRGAKPRSNPAEQLCGGRADAPAAGRGLPPGTRGRSLRALRTATPPSWWSPVFGDRRGAKGHMRGEGGGRGRSSGAGDTRAARGAPGGGWRRRACSPRAGARRRCAVGSAAAPPSGGHRDRARRGAPRGAPRRAVKATALR